MNLFSILSLATVLLSISSSWVYGQSQTPKFEFEFNRHKYLQDFAQKVNKSCTEWYPKIAKFLFTTGYPDPTKIVIRFDPNYDGVAYAEWDKSRITGSTKYYRDHQNDVGSMIHEMTHIIQRYPGNCPGWYVEGLADYVRYFQYEPARKPGKPSSNQSYQNGYGVAAYFLNYLSEKVKGGKDALLQANKGCRDRNYRDSIWDELTGKNLKDLWSEMMEKA